MPYRDREITVFDKEWMRKHIIHIQKFGELVDVIESRVFSQESIRLIFELYGSTYEIEEWAGKVFFYSKNEACTYAYDISYLFE